MQDYEDRVRRIRKARNFYRRVKLTSWPCMVCGEKGCRNRSPFEQKSISWYIFVVWYGLVLPPILGPILWHILRTIWKIRKGLGWAIYLWLFASYLYAGCIMNVHVLPGGLSCHSTIVKALSLLEWIGIGYTTPMLVSIVKGLFPILEPILRALGSILGPILELIIDVINHLFEGLIDILHYLFWRIVTG